MVVFVCLRGSLWTWERRKWVVWRPEVAFCVCQTVRERRLWVTYRMFELTSCACGEPCRSFPDWKARWSRERAGFGHVPLPCPCWDANRCEMEPLRHLVVVNIVNVHLNAKSYHQKQTNSETSSNKFILYFLTVTESVDALYCID